MFITLFFLHLQVEIGTFNMKWSLLLIGLCVLISLEFGLGYPLDDENNGKKATLILRVTDI